MVGPTVERFRFRQLVLWLVASLMLLLLLLGTRPVPSSIGFARYYVF